MGIIDNMKDKMEDMSMDNMRREYEALREKKRMGMLDEKGMERFERLRERIGLS